MRSIRGNTGRLPTEGLVGTSQNHVQNEPKTVRNGVIGDGHGASEEDESRIQEEANEGQRKLVHEKAILNAQQQQPHGSQGPQGPQGSVVRWERFLPVRSLKVLLVENDDSTRHVVSALLRNCSYEVTPVSNGLEAWKILEDLTNHIDLVLTEVAMPGLTGIGLLSKIMNHKTCKNIPVIMMSSNDSMGIVFKCLSKGAVDFLVKPIRKNELKNLWQHVWRKCHSSSGSGSESGIRTQKSTKSKSVEGLENNTDSNDEEDNGSIGVNYRDGSDNGSGTQSSWSKRAVEVDSPQPMSLWDDLAEPPDSTCAQFIRSRPEAHSSNWVPINATRKSERQDEETDNVAMGKDLSIGVPRNQDLINGPSDKVLGKIASNEKAMFLDPDKKKDGDKLERNISEYNNETANNEFQDKDNDLTGVVTVISVPQGGSAQNEVANETTKISKIKDMDKKELPSLELSLKRLRDVSNTGISAQERNKLRQSDHSAFSRYNTTSTTNQGPTGNVGSCSPVNNSSEVAKTESLQNLQSNSSGTPNQGSNGSSNNNDMGSTTNNVLTKPDASNEKLIPRSTVNTRPSSAGFQPVQQGHSPSTQTMQPGIGDTSKDTVAQARAMQQHAQVEHHHHHHYHHHHHHVHSSLQQQQQLLNNNDLSLRERVSIAPHSGQSNMVRMQVEGNAANYGSASGSNNGSNGQNVSSGQNGSSTAINVEGMNIASDNGVTMACEAGSGSAVDQDRLAQQKEHREIALNKFRKKRKERCFEKKVRYQSRKKLAEQRPRVRGQFVKQAVDEVKPKDKGQDANS